MRTAIQDLSCPLCSGEHVSGYINNHSTACPNGRREDTIQHADMQRLRKRRGKPFIRPATAHELNLYQQFVDEEIDQSEPTPKTTVSAVTNSIRRRSIDGVTGPKPKDKE